MKTLFSDLISWLVFGFLALALASSANAFLISDCDGTSSIDSPVDFDEDIQPIFDANCVHCHQPETLTHEQVGLDLRPGRSYWSLVGRPSSQVNSFLVYPSAGSSYLMTKLLCDAPDQGARMPLDSLPLEPEDRNMLQRWISLGAMPGLEEEKAIETQAGMAGSWFDPDTAGQGMSIEVFELNNASRAPRVLVYWFTFGEPGEQVDSGQRWYLADGSLWPDEASGLLNILTATGGAFDRPEPAAEVGRVGTAVMKFNSCQKATFVYQLDADEDEAEAKTGEISLRRLSPIESCEDE